MSRRRRWSEAALALAVVLASGSAHAQETSDSQKNAATSLFEEGNRLMRDGKVDEACAKLKESFRLYAASGTLLNLALCHERAGKTGSAYTEFNESLARAQRDRRPEREQTARTHLAALAPKLSRVTVTVAAGSEVAGLEVTLDGVALQKPAWGVATIVDPGEHVVVATAPHRTAWKKAVTVGAAEAAPVSVEVPALAEEPAAAPAAAATTAPPATVPATAPAAEHEEPAAASTGSAQRTLGVVAAIAGVASAGTATVLALVAQNKWNAAKTDCPNALCPDDATRTRDSGAGGLADAATVLFAVGGAALAAGAVLYFTAPSAPARVGVIVTPGGAAAGIGGTW